MSYETGTALHIDDLLSKLSLFATTNGWTQDKITAGSGDGASSELYLSKGSSFFSFEGTLSLGSHQYHGSLQSIDKPTLKIYGNTGFNGALAVDDQPNSSGAADVDWLLPNMTAYHFFTDPTQTYLHAVVETTLNEFRHFAVGLSNKAGVYEGGEYVIGQTWDQRDFVIDLPVSTAHGYPWASTGNSGNTFSKFHINIDGVRWRQYLASTLTANIIGAFTNNGTGFLDPFLTGAFNSRISTPNTFNNVSPLFSIPCGWINRSATIASPTGHFPDVRMVNIKNLQPGSTLTLGTDEWLIFPATEKKDPSLQDNLPNSGYIGYAYFKVP